MPSCLPFLCFSLSVSLPFTFLMCAGFALQQQVSSLYIPSMKEKLNGTSNTRAIHICRSRLTALPQARIQIRLHVFCSLNISIFHIRIKFLTDLLPCGSKHQNLTVSERNNRRSGLQTASSVTNVQFKWSWVYETDKLFCYIIKFVSNLSFIYACNKHLLWPRQNYSFSLVPAVSNYFWM